MFDKLISQKWIRWTAGLLGAILILLVIAFYQAPQVNPLLEVIFFDVGQGDAILIKTPNHQKILIDGGPGNAVLNKLGRHLPFFEKEIDLVILTHPHADHLEGLIEVLKRYKVLKILSTGVVHTTPEYLAWLEAIKKQNVPMEIAKAGQSIDFGGSVRMEILHPFADLSGEKVENFNNSSIVSKLVFGNIAFLFTGDVETEVEQQMIEKQINLKANVLKVAHHGSSDATSQEFLDQIKPQIAVIQVGRSNKFGHPSLGVIKRLKKMDVQIIRTDQDGDVKIMSDGQKAEVGR